MEHQSCHTVPLTDDVIQNPMSFENNNAMSTVSHFQKFQPLIPKNPLKHQYLLETNYIRMIPTMSSTTSIKIEV